MVNDKVTFGHTMTVDKSEEGYFEAVVVCNEEQTLGWLAELSSATPGNRLNVFYSRKYYDPVFELGKGRTEGFEKVFYLGDGTYEAESVGAFGPHRYVFGVTDGRLAWSYSMTFSKRLALTKVAEALSPAGV